MKVDIGIIGALEEEVSSIINMLSDYKKETAGGIDFHLGTLYGKSVVISRCGVGKVFAAICAQAMIIKYSPSLIVNTGVAGALSPELRCADIVIGSELCQHDMDTSPLGDPVGLISGINKIFFECDMDAVNIIKDSCEQNNYRYLVGRIASGDKFIAEKSEKEKIISAFSAYACEMEGAAIAHTAFVNSTPFVVIRAISDSADGEASMSYLEFLPIAAERSSRLTLSLVKNYKV